MSAGELERLKTVERIIDKKYETVITGNELTQT